MDRVRICEKQKEKRSRNIKIERKVREDVRREKKMSRSPNLTRHHILKRDLEVGIVRILSLLDFYVETVDLVRNQHRSRY